MIFQTEKVGCTILEEIDSFFCMKLTQEEFPWNSPLVFSSGKLFDILIHVGSTYSRAKHHLFFLLLLGVGHWLGFTFWPFVLWGGWMFLMRKKKVDLSRQWNENSIYAPVDGRVIGVKKASEQSMVSLELFVSFFNQGGLYLPMTADVERCHTNLKMEESVELTDSDNRRILISWRRSRFFKWPELWIAPGDKGKAGASIGHFFPGSTMFLSLPVHSDIQVKTGETIMAAKTVLANWREGGEA